ncbi:ClpX C4-type zinc finger-like protein, partial [Leptospira santarosai str. CBC1531]
MAKKTSGTNGKQKLFCSFCGKEQDAVKRLV